jgi:hypothetical protein
MAREQSAVASLLLTRRNERFLPRALANKAAAARWGKGKRATRS